MVMMDELVALLKTLFSNTFSPPTATSDIHLPANVVVSQPVQCGAFEDCLKLVAIFGRLGWLFR
jgi:hypothetical protein